jgi:hypothetical protein
MTALAIIVGLLIAYALGRHRGYGHAAAAAIEAFKTELAITKEDAYQAGWEAAQKQADRDMARMTNSFRLVEVLDACRWKPAPGSVTDRNMGMADAWLTELRVHIWTRDVDPVAAEAVDSVIQRLAWRARDDVEAGEDHRKTLPDAAE